MILCYFLWSIRYSFISRKLASIMDLSIFCFAVYFENTFYLYVGSLFSSPLICHLLCLLSSTCPFPLHFVQCFEDCFPYHQLCFWFVDFASYYFNVFIGSAVILFLLSVSFFNCQLLFYLILMFYHLIFDIFFYIILLFYIIFFCALFFQNRLFIGLFPAMILSLFLTSVHFSLTYL